MQMLLYMSMGGPIYNIMRNNSYSTPTCSSPDLKKYNCINIMPIIHHKINSMSIYM